MNWMVSPVRKLLLSALIGILTMGVAWTTLQQKEKKITATQKMATVLRARKYVSVGQSMTADLMEEWKVPEAYKPPGALSQVSELLNGEGVARFKSRIGLMKGEVISRSALVDANSLGFAWSLDPGHHALSLRLNTEEAVAGLLRPGDRVALLHITPKKSRILLPHVLIAAVGEQTLDSARTVDAEDFSKPVAGDSIMITLVLTAEQALMVRSASSKGIVTLILASALNGV